MVVQYGSTTVYGNEGSLADSLNNMEAIEFTHTGSVKVFLVGARLASNQAYSLVIRGQTGTTVSTASGSPTQTGRVGSFPTFTTKSTSQISTLCGNFQGSRQVLQFNFQWGPVSS